MNKLLGLILNRRVLEMASAGIVLWFAYGYAYDKGADAVQARWDAAVSTATVKMAVGTAANAEKTVEVVTEYVEKQVFVDRPVVVERLVRVCDNPGSGAPGVPAAGGNPAVPAGAARGETLDALAGEARECVADSDRLAALQRIVREQCL